MYGWIEMTYYNRDCGPYIPPKKYGPRFDPTDVRALREHLGCGLVEAKSNLMRDQILEDLKLGKQGLDTALLYDILTYLIENNKIRC